MDLPPVYEPVWLAIFGAILGAIIGSFVAALVSRWPKNISVVAGRSHCDGCGKTLRARELIPVFSHILQRGTCRSCSARIGRDPLAIECIAAGVGAVAFAFLSLPQGVAGAMLGWQLLALAWLDIRHLWLPDRLNLGLAVTGLGAAYFLPVTHITDSLIGGLAGFSILALLSAVYRMARGRDGLGGGDAKMLGAIGLWTGWQALPFVLLGASVCGLAVAAVMIVRGGQVDRTTRLPLGTLMAPAAFVCWFAQALWG